MDFLKKLKEAGEKAIETIATDENKEKAKNFLAGMAEKIGEVTEEVKDKLEDFAEEINAEKEAETASAPQTDTVIKLTSDEEELSCEAKILKVLAEEFPEYTVKKNVSPLTIGGTGRFMDYSIAVYKNEVPKLFIMLIGKTTCAHREYRWSKQEAEKNGIAFINFIVHYPNELTYITNRLHQYL